MSYGGRVTRPMQSGPLIGLLTHRQWLSVVMLGIVTGSLGLFFSHISQWIPLGFGLAGVVTGHMIIASRFSLPLPQTAILISLVYYLFVPITNIYYPTANPLYKLIDPPSYFAYAVPCLWAAATGWFFAFYRAKPIQLNANMAITDSNLYQGLDLLIIAGMGIVFVMSFVRLPGSIATLAMLAANMRYIGVFGWTLMARPGWKWRLGLVLTVDLFQSVSTGFFLNFLLWAVNAAVVIMFRQRFSTARILAGIALVAVLLPCFQHAKWELRRASWGVALGEQRLVVFGTMYHLNSLNKMPLLFAKVLESSYTLITGEQSDEFIADTALRYNQGWIVARVQKHVPIAEDYANGETVYGAILASIFPRFLMPDKLMNGGNETFTRFSGIQLNSTTSMNLGFVGEMYANYGYALGIIGCGVYCLFFGIIFQRLTAAAHNHIIMLSFIPYILNFAVVSEVGLVDVLNYTVKSLMVAAAIYMGAPAVFSRINRYRAQFAAQQANQRWR